MSKTTKHSTRVVLQTLNDTITAAHPQTVRWKQTLPDPQTCHFHYIFTVPGHASILSQKHHHRRSYQDNCGVVGSVKIYCVT